MRAMAAISGARLLLSSSGVQTPSHSISRPQKCSFSLPWKPKAHVSMALQNFSPACLPFLPSLIAQTLPCLFLTPIWRNNPTDAESGLKSNIKIALWQVWVIFCPSLMAYNMVVISKRRKWIWLPLLFHTMTNADPLSTFPPRSGISPLFPHPRQPLKDITHLFCSNSLHGSSLRASFTPLSSSRVLKPKNSLKSSKLHLIQRRHVPYGKNTILRKSFR